MEPTNITTISYVIAVNDFFDGCADTESIDEEETIGVYADTCHEALTAAYPNAKIEVEISTNALSSKLSLFTAHGSLGRDSDEQAWANDVLSRVWDGGTFWVEKAPVA